jgi:MtN3 and saliva related transmembrane protein
MTEKQKEVIGTIAGTLTTGSFVPQAWRIWHHAPQPAPDVSLMMYIIISLGVLLWVTYGFLLRCKPILIFNIITFVLSVSVIIYKMTYG